MYRKFRQKNRAIYVRFLDGIDTCFDLRAGHTYVGVCNFFLIFYLFVLQFLKFYFLLFADVLSNPERRGPMFTIEPEPLYEFMNSTGATVVCSSHGNPSPSIRWIKKDGSIVTNISGLRHIRADGTLVFSPFRAEEYRQDVHATIYRCIAYNVVGSISSRDVNVRAGKLVFIFHKSHSLLLRYTELA